MPGPVDWRVHMAEHDRRRCRKARAVRCLDNIEPLLRAELVRAKVQANGIIKYFRSRSRQRSKPCVAQHAEVTLEGNAEAFSAVRDLEGRESVDVHAG